MYLRGLHCSYRARYVLSADDARVSAGAYSYSNARSGSDKSATNKTVGGRSRDHVPHQFCQAALMRYMVTRSASDCLIGGALVATRTSVRIGVCASRHPGVVRAEDIPGPVRAVEAPQIHRLRLCETAAAERSPVDKHHGELAGGSGEPT